MVRKVERELQDRRLKNGVKRDFDDDKDEDKVNAAMKRDLAKAQKRKETETDVNKRRRLEEIIRNIENFLSKYKTK